MYVTYCGQVQKFITNEISGMPDDSLTAVHTTTWVDMLLTLYAELFWENTNILVFSIISRHEIALLV